MGEIPVSSDPWESPARECMKRSAVPGLGWHSGSLAVSIIIVGNRPKVDYKYDIVKATLCHTSAVSLGCQQATGWTNGGPACLVSLAQLVIKPGKNIWVPYKLDHLWIMNFGWQNSRPRAIVLKTVALTSVVTSFPPASSGLLWFFPSRKLFQDPPGRADGLLSGICLPVQPPRSSLSRCSASLSLFASCTRLKASWRPLLFIFGFPLGHWSGT